MSPNEKDHLTQDQLMMAMVDTKDLPDSVVAHLESCVQCRQKKDAIARRFENLGKMARKLSPEPMRAVRLKDYKMKNRLRQKWRIIPALGIAVAAVLMLVTFWMPRVFNKSTQMADHADPIEIIEDRRFMAEVEKLLENPLPDGYRDLIPVEPEMADDFMDFIVPGVSNESPSLS